MSSLPRYRLHARLAGVDESEPISGINTTPLIDVMLVLLIMFILTIPAQIQQVPMALPQAGPVAPTEQQPHLLVIDREGAVTIDGAALAGAALDTRLAALAHDPRAELRIRTDDETRYEAFVTTLAAVKRAGITRLGFVGNPTRI